MWPLRGCPRGEKAKLAPNPLLSMGVCWLTPPQEPFHLLSADAHLSAALRWPEAHLINPTHQVHVGAHLPSRPDLLVAIQSFSLHKAQAHHSPPQLSRRFFFPPENHPRAISIWEVLAETGRVWPSQGEVAACQERFCALLMGKGGTDNCFFPFPFLERGRSCTHSVTSVLS